MDRSVLGKVADPKIPRAAAAATAVAAADPLHPRTVGVILRSRPAESFRRPPREPRSPGTCCLRSRAPAGADVLKSALPSFLVRTVVVVLPKSFVSEGGGALDASGRLHTRGWSVGFRIGGVDTCRKESRRTWSPWHVGQSKAQHVLNDVSSRLQDSFLATVSDPLVTQHVQ